MTSPLRLFLMLLVPACGFPRPPNIVDDAAPSIDAGPSIDAAAANDAVPSIDAAPPIDAIAIDAPPGTTILVEPTGNDANNGTTAPVKTLKRALVLAGANTEIRAISLAAGGYAASTGEIFPYTVPPNLVISGPSTGSAILVGSSTEAGLTIGTGKLLNLELESFTVAIDASGAVDLSNVKIRNSKLAVSGGQQSRLTASQLDITGTIGASMAECQNGISLVGGADFSATMLTTRSLVNALSAKDSSTVHLSHASLTQDPRCAGVVVMFNTNKTLVVSDSVLTSGFVGMGLAGGADVSVVNTTISNMKNAGVNGASVNFHMMGGAISDNGGLGVSAGSGSWSFVNVNIEHNTEGGLFVADGSYTVLARLKMRGCLIDRNAGDGINLFDFSAADLGTDDDPGNNTIQANLGRGVSSCCDVGPPLVNAVGNLWNPGMQGADSQGRYPVPPVTIVGPVAGMNGNNYAVGVGLSIRR